MRVMVQCTLHSLLDQYILHSLDDVPGCLHHCHCLLFVLFVCRPCVIDCHVADGDVAPGSCVKRGEG